LTIEAKGETFLNFAWRGLSGYLDLQKPEVREETDFRQPPPLSLPASSFFSVAATA